MTQVIENSDPDHLLRQFDEFIPLTATMVKVKKGDKCGIFSRETNCLVVQILYNDIVAHTETSAILELDGKRGIFSEKSFRCVVPVIYQSVASLSERYVRVGDGNRFGVCLIQTSELVVPIEYDDVAIEHDTLLVSYGGHQGIFDVKTKTIQWE